MLWNYLCKLKFWLKGVAFVRIYEFQILLNSRGVATCSRFHQKLNIAHIIYTQLQLIFSILQQNLNRNSA